MRHAWLALLLAGCISIPPPPAAPWPREPLAYLAPIGSGANAGPGMEGRFPIDLPTVLRLAGANSLEIAFVREKVDEAYARTRLAEERTWPVLIPGVAFRRHEGITQATEGEFVDVDKQQSFAGAGARVRWEVGEAVFATLSASQRYEASRSQLEATEQRSVLEAGEAYYDLVREQSRARVAAQAAESAARLAEELDAAFQAGRAFEGDVLRARVQQTRARLEHLEAEESIRLASMRLGTLLRLASGIELYPAEAAPAPLELVSPGVPEGDLVGEALERRPEIRQALADLDAERYEQRAATWGPLVPEIEIAATAGGLGAVPSDFKSTEDYAVLVGWRIGPGGLFDSGRRRLAGSRVRQAEIHLARVRQGIVAEVRSNLSQVRALEEQKRLAERAVTDAERALSLNQERQRHGIGIPLEVLQAEDALARARMDYFTAIVESNQAQLRVFAAAGRSHDPTDSRAHSEKSRSS